MLWIILALLSGFGASCFAIISKLYLKHLNPYLVTFAFSIVSFIFLLTFDAFTHKVHCNLITSLTTKDLIVLFFSGCLTCISFLLYVNALKYGKACGVVAIDRAGILFTIILSAILLNEKITSFTVIGAILMIMGVVLVNF